MPQRLNHFEQSSSFAQKLLALSNALAQGSVEQSLRDLVHIRASQLNGCAFCLDMHAKEAKVHGERELRLYHLSIWHESPLFTPRERAALAWTELLTKIPAEGVPDAAYDAVRAEFSEKELSDLTYDIVTINAWNRLGVGFRPEPGALDKSFGLDKAGLN
jgi:AhpD family alkylhydroperoxidase